LCSHLYVGEALQTIVNQDNNLLRRTGTQSVGREFDVSRNGSTLGWLNQDFRKRLDGNAAKTAPVALVGFREWIFSASVNSWFIFFLVIRC
jgi:hypothetical protein